MIQCFFLIFLWRTLLLPYIILLGLSGKMFLSFDGKKIHSTTEETQLSILINILYQGSCQLLPIAWPMNEFMQKLEINNTCLICVSFLMTLLQACNKCLMPIILVSHSATVTYILWSVILLNIWNTIDVFSSLLEWLIIWHGKWCHSTQSLQPSFRSPVVLFSKLSTFLISIHQCCWYDSLCNLEYELLILADHCNLYSWSRKFA